jgi:hypothetical protein
MVQVPALTAFSTAAADGAGSSSLLLHEINTHMIGIISTTFNVLIVLSVSNVNIQLISNDQLTKVIFVRELLVNSTYGILLKSFFARTNLAIERRVMTSE